MLNEAQDFREECDALSAILINTSEEGFRKTTLFNRWTIEDVIGHLHVWNRAALLTLENREKFTDFFKYAMQHFGSDGSSLPIQYAWFDEKENGIRGRAIFDAWRELCPQVADSYRNADPQLRVAWAGPDMTTQSKIIARQMETWAHGQEIFDVLGLERKNKDRIRNIAHLGVKTYGWAFRNRSETPPNPKPYVKLVAPSGALWEWNDPQNNNMVEGKAEEFCQIVTQTRNAADTNIRTVGETAKQWMKIAQCFAGPPKSSPAKGERYKAT